MANTYLSRTFGTATNRLICTASMWVKRSALGGAVFWNSYNSGTYRFQFYFDGSNRLGLLNVDSGSNNVELITNRLFRDVSAWYHIQAVIDTTQGTAANRVKIYVNGVQETSFATETYPSQNADMSYGNSSYSCQIGRYGGGSDYFEGSMSHIHFIDGTAYDATAFGEYDANGVWKIKTDVSVTYGNEGFFILKNGNSVTDQSGNSNNFTVAGGTLTNTEDNPSNVFATLNPLSFNTGFSLSNGNNYFNGGSITSWEHGCASTIGASSGKYYWEVKWKNGTSVSIVGVIPIDQSYRCNNTGGSVYNYSNSWQLANNQNGDKYSYVASNSSGFQRAHDDVIMFAMDMDNKKLWSGANGTWYSSGNPATGANPTWDTSEFPSDWDNGFIPYCQSYYSGVVTEFAFNFGNGYFGTTPVSSAGTNASGNGIFEYDVPTGFTALSTKGLNL